MRIGLSSSSEASEDEGAATSLRHRSMPTRDLRTPAGKAGAATIDYYPAAFSSTNPTPRPHGTSRGSRLIEEEDSGGAKPQNGSPAADHSRTRQEPGCCMPPWIKAQSKNNPKSRDTVTEAQSEAESSSSSSSASSSKHSAQPTRRRSEGRSNRRSNTQVSYSSNSRSRDYKPASLSSSGEESLEALERSQLDTSDSEELEWPVEPRKLRCHKSKDPRRLSNATKPHGRDRETVHSIRLAAEEDEWEAGWTDAVHRSGRRWASKAYRKSESPFSGPSDGAQKVRGETRSPQVGEDVSGVRSILQRLTLEKDEQDRKERQEFEEREKKLWGSIEGAIKAAEDKARNTAKQEEERLAAARQAQEEAAQKAKAAKEDEERRERQNKEAIEKQRVEAEAKKQADDRQQQMTQQKTAAEAEDKDAMKTMGVGDVLHDQAKVDYDHWNGMMKQIKDKVLPMVSDNPQWRKQCFAAKRQITPKIGQLTNSRGEIWRITLAISDLLKEARAAPCPNQEIYQWVINHICKCLIRQAEQEVAVKVDTAFPLARVVLWLLLDGHNKLGEILMARLVKKSCWCLGYVPGKQTDQHNVAYSKAVGRASLEETSVQFASRQSGIVAFYFAICQTPPEPGPSQPAADLSLVPPHFRPAALWVWQARCVTPPMTLHAIVPTLWSTLLEVAGPRLLEYHGRQTSKVWELLYNQGIMAGKARFVQIEEGKAASGRLQLLLEDWKKAGKLPMLKGRQMEP